MREFLLEVKEHFESADLIEIILIFLIALGLAIIIVAKTTTFKEP